MVQGMGTYHRLAGQNALSNHMLPQVLSTLKRKLVFYIKMGHGLFFFFSSFQANITILTTNKCEKMSIQSTALGFDLTTFWLQVSSLNH